VACDSYTLTNDSSLFSTTYNAGPGVVPSNPRYFWVNGDEEWLAIWLHAQGIHYGQAVLDFDDDPVALYIHFPYGKEKTIYKSKIYFKEKFNFRSFALSTYGGAYYTQGDADDYHYDLIPIYSKIILDNNSYYDGSPTYSLVADYLFENPCVGHMIAAPTSNVIYEWDPIYSDLIQDYAGTGGTMAESGWFTTQNFAVTNSESWQTARRVDWQIIEHQWEPTTCQGFRIYCDYHKSTKITEMELYCVAEDIGSNLSGGIAVTFSDYGDLWWPAEATQLTEETVDIFIGDSPRYITLDLSPVTETLYEDVVIYVKTDDLYIGTKGCDYVQYTNAAKTNATNQAQLIEVKNTYSNPYDLYVDISRGKIIDKGLVFYSPLNNQASITNPVMGPDALYHKPYDYLLVNQDYNCAINCHTFGLNNLIDGQTAHYSHSDMMTWTEWGTLSHGSSIDFDNLPDTVRTVVTIPALSRNRYWKFGFTEATISLNVRELDVFDVDGNALYPVEFYHDLSTGFTDSVSERAPHLDNNSVVGSYYVLTENQYITLYFDEQVVPGRIEFYHDYASGYESFDKIVSFYVSDDNLFFGHYADVEITENTFSDQYNAYFAIDLGHRHALGLLRRYGASDDLYVDLTTNVVYSDIDTDDPYEAFMTEVSFDPDDDFYGYNHLLIDKDKWYTASSVQGVEEEYLSMDYGRLEHKVDSDIDNIRFYSTYQIRGDFDIEIKCGKISAPNTAYWHTIFRVDGSDGPNGSNYVNCRIEYRGNGYVAKVLFGSDGSTSSSYAVLSANDSGLRIQRVNNTFYGKYYNAGTWYTIGSADLDGFKGKDVRIHIGLQTTDNYPTIKMYWRDFKINSAERIVQRSTYSDARWVAFELLNGDGTDRYLKKLGIYPSLTMSSAPDGANYNASWTDLGPSITNYSTGDNVALGATVSGSSFKNPYLVEHITDGIISNDRSHAWLSDNSSEQWVLIDLGSAKQIYRVKVYHGYSTDDSDFIIEDYRIESSVDGQSFTTRWTVSSNSSFTRTHDKASPFTARYIRMYITDYKADNVFFIKESDGIQYYEWQGACLREIEVYEYYGFSYVSSEEYPIVAINLRDQFYIQGHSLVGLYTEDTSYDWDNSSSNFAWSDSVHQEPKKVTFTAWGAEPDYEQWVVIKRDTATEHGGIDYLKHAVISSDTKENPINYPWWWSATLSELSRDFTKDVEFGTSSLKIDYPASTALDTVQFIEGSDWGVDSDTSFRDGLCFRWYIDDVDKLDTSDGYVFFGGTDGTNTPADVEYRWNMSTLSGVLQNGWNRPFFRFRTADECVYNENFDPFSVIRPDMPEYVTWKTFGIKFKGKGQTFSMNLDGSLIQRNHFSDSSKFDYGLYLTGSDYLECPLAELDLRAGTIEFWLRPDYTFVGYDSYNRFVNRCLFNFCNVANDVFGLMINSEGFNMYYGNLSTDLKALLVQGMAAGSIDGLFHIGVVFSSNGKHLDSDGSSIKLYLNNELVATNYDTWTYSDEKLFKFTLGGKPPLGLIEHSNSLEASAVDGVVSNLRIYNYCKTDFTDSMNNTFSENGTDLLLPSKMIEISQDNLTFYKVGDAELPFIFEKVPVGNTIPIYVRSTIPSGLTGKEDRTAGIITSWYIGV
jgi:hypothetical protein